MVLSWPGLVFQKPLSRNDWTWMTFIKTKSTHWTPSCSKRLNGEVMSRSSYTNSKSLSKTQDCCMFFQRLPIVWEFGKWVHSDSDNGNTFTFYLWWAWLPEWNISVALRQPEQQHVAPCPKTNFWTSDTKYSCTKQVFFSESSYWEAREGRVNEGRSGHLKILQQNIQHNKIYQCWLSILPYQYTLKPNWTSFEPGFPELPHQKHWISTNGR